MNVKKELLDNGYIKLVVEASTEEVDEAFATGLDLFVEQIGLPAEAGKTALQQIDAYLGERKQEAIGDAVMNYLLPFALDESKETPVVSPVAVPESAPEKGKPFKFTVEIYPKPEYELSSYEPVTITVAANPVTEEDIDQQMLMIAQNATTTQPDIMTGEMKQVTPNITDSWVEKNIPDADIKSVEDLRARLREAGAQFKAEELEQQKANLAVGEMTKRFKDTIPDEVVSSMAADMVAGAKAQIAAQGMSYEDYLNQVQMTDDQFEYNMESQAKQMLCEGFTLDAVFRHANLKVEEADIRAAITAMAPGNEAETEKRLRETGRMFALDEAAQRMKAGKWILEQAKVMLEG